jgi:hypothetical protein
VRGVDLLDPPLVHDHDAVRRHHGLRLVVRHVDRGDLEGVVQAADLEAHLLAQIGVEVAERLIEQQHLGLDHDGARQGHTLLLAARQLGGIASLEIAHLDHVEDGVDPAVDLGARQLAHLQAEADILAHRHVRPDGVALEDHRHAPLLGRHDARRRGDLLAIHLDRAGRRRYETGDHAQRGGLAAARRTEQRDELSRGKLQREIGHGLDRTVQAGDVPERKLAHVAVRLSMKSRPRAFWPIHSSGRVRTCRIKASAARYSRLPSSLMSKIMTDATLVFGP